MKYFGMYEVQWKKSVKNYFVLDLLRCLVDVMCVEFFSLNFKIMSIETYWAFDIENNFWDSSKKMKEITFTKSFQWNFLSFAGSPIQRFYSKKSVFMTGASGFLGKGEQNQIYEFFSQDDENSRWASKIFYLRRSLKILSSSLIKLFHFSSDSKLFYKPTSFLKYIKRKV